MSRAPGLFTSFGNGESFGKVVKGLESVIHFDFGSEAAADFFLESLFKVTANHKDDFAETGADGVINGVIKDDFTVGAHGVKLLEATVTAAHPGCKNKECRFHNTGRIMTLSCELCKS